MRDKNLVIDIKTGIEIIEDFSLEQQAEYDSARTAREEYTRINAYRQNRRNEYPAIGDQLDMLFKAMDAGVLPKVPEFYNSIKAVKDKYPVAKD
jgi:hypothetical protein